METTNERAELDPIKMELDTIKAQMFAVIKTQAEAEKAGAFGKVIKDAKARITDFFEPKKKRARAAWQDWLDAEKAELEPWEALDAENRRALAGFAQAEAEARKIAVEKARAQAEAKAEKKTEKTGIYHAPAPVAEAAKVSTTAAKFRTDWKFAIEDAEKIPAMFMIPDEKAIRAYVASKKDKAAIPGIRVYSVQTPVI